MFNKIKKYIPIFSESSSIFPIENENTTLFSSKPVTFDQIHPFSSSSTITLYFDLYERDYGDGFYPILICQPPTTTPVEIKFNKYAIRDTYCWKQSVDSECIDGFDGGIGEAVMNVLDPAAPKGSKILNSVGDELFVKV